MLRTKAIFVIAIMLIANSANAALKICGPGGHCCIKPFSITCRFMAKPSDDVNASKLRLTKKVVSFDKCEDAMASTDIRDEDKQFIKTTELCQPKQDANDVKQ